MKKFKNNFFPKRIAGKFIRFVYNKRVITGIDPGPSGLESDHQSDLSTLYFLPHSECVKRLRWMNPILPVLTIMTTNIILFLLIIALEWAKTANYIHAEVTTLAHALFPLNLENVPNIPWISYLLFSQKLLYYYQVTPNSAMDNYYYHGFSVNDGLSQTWTVVNRHLV